MVHTAIINAPLERLERLQQNLETCDTPKEREFLIHQIEKQREYLKHLGYCVECES